MLVESGAEGFGKVACIGGLVETDVQPTAGLGHFPTRPKILIANRKLVVRWLLVSSFWPFGEFLPSSGRSRRRFGFIGG